MNKSTTPTYKRFVQWKTWIICLQNIYCKQWNNYIITVQHSPLLVQSIYASAWQACRFRGKKIFRMGAQPLMRCQPNLIVVPELQSTQHILQRTKDVKIRWHKVGWVQRVWDTLKPQLLNSRHCCCSSMWSRTVVEETHACRQPTPFLVYSWLQIFPQKVWVGGTGHSASSGHVVLKIGPL